jgi:2-polyprenyl-3-methyl-5-hydroxy-6-metoxy-1,4-benzoquinol methylase
MQEPRTLFWDRKIQKWETKRYRNPRSPIAQRAEFARQILRQVAQGTRILDLGCGTGQLLRSLPPQEFAHLHGVDFSPEAIRAAQTQAWADNVSFECADAVEYPFENHDVIVGLGLLDWLDDAQLEKLLARLSGRRFLLSFSNASAWRARLLHAAFVQLTYGWRQGGGYVPRYYRAQELSFYLGPESSRRVRFANLPQHPLVGFMMSV